MKLCDAHCHYQFAEVPYAAVEEARQWGVAEAMVNGSAPSDWEDVAALARRDPRNLTSFGVHPWDVPTVPAGWATTLEHYLEKYPAAGVGEVGLDQWIEGYDIVAQGQVFREQWTLAIKWQRPVTIHSVRATGPLMEHLRSLPPLASGFLLHSWNGPAELVSELVQRGAYFSFSPYHFAESKLSLREQFKSVIPRDRILIETDAPALCPAPKDCLRTLPPGEDGKPANHPVNLVKVNEMLAQNLEQTLEQTAALTTENFARLFLRR